MAKLSPTIILNNGIEVPVVGLGTATALDEIAEASIIKALDVGYRHIDTAAYYGNEEAIGRALASSGINRGELIITTKLWCADHGVDQVKSACLASLKRLRLSYIDIYLIHWPLGFKVSGKEKFLPLTEYTIVDLTPIEATWREMEALVDKGLVKCIGLSNFNRAQIERILKICRIKPAMLQIEVSVNFLNTKLIEFAISHGIQVTAYAPLGSPGLKPGISSPFKADFVLEIASRHQKTPGQILIRHAVQRNICVIPKSQDLKRIEENFQIFDFELSETEMELLNTKGQSVRVFGQKVGVGTPNGPLLVNISSIYCSQAPRKPVLIYP